MLAPLAVMLVDEPRHKLVDPPNVIVGLGLTVIARIAVFLQPLALVPVTVYVTLTVGEQVIGVPVVAVNPVDGVHV